MEPVEPILEDSLLKDGVEQRGDSCFKVREVIQVKIQNCAIASFQVIPNNHHRDMQSDTFMK